LNFTGDTQDIVAGTYDTPNRELNPAQGRWISPDPVQSGWNRYAYVQNNPCNSIDPSGLSPCSLSVGISFPGSFSSSYQKQIEATVRGLFGPDIGLQFVVNGSGDVNLSMSALTASPFFAAGGEAGAVPTPNGTPVNWGLVDFGAVLEAQYELRGPQGQTNRLAAALGRVGAHELAHELFVGHNPFGGGLMASHINPFANLQFSDSEKTNLLSRCLYLHNSASGASSGGGGGGSGNGGLSGYPTGWQDGLWLTWGDVAVVTSSMTWWAPLIEPEKK